jgi:hypothetical protein
MILEVLRLVTDWLNDQNTGLVAQLALIPYDDGDVPPAVGTIADETRDPNVALQLLPSSPGVAVNIQQIPQLDGEVATVSRDGMAQVLIRVGRDSADTQHAVRDTSYILRALIRSLRLFNASTRSRNAIDVYSCERLAIRPVWTPIDDTIVTGAVVAHWQFRDNAP